MVWLILAVPATATGVVLGRVLDRGRMKRPVAGLCVPALTMPDSIAEVQP